VPYDRADREEVLERVRRHQLDMLIDFERGVFVLNSESNTAPVLRLLVGSGAEGILREESVSGAPIRYVDWLIPGIIGMNMMFSCLFGVGYVIVRYRKNGVLKRLKATPVSALTFVTAQAFSRFVIVIITSVVVFIGTNLIFSFVMNGSYFTLLVLTMAAIFCMIAIGLVFAARLRSEELANGLMNLVTLPMLALSGVFFSLEGSPDILQRISRFLPANALHRGSPRRDGRRRGNHRCSAQHCGAAGDRRGRHPPVGNALSLGLKSRLQRGSGHPQRRPRLAMGFRPQKCLRPQKNIRDVVGGPGTCVVLIEPVPQESAGRTIRRAEILSGGDVKLDDPGYIPRRLSRLTGGDTPHDREGDNKN
jgi:hypothetical protein